jgi:hypothetical protein
MDINLMIALVIVALPLGLALLFRVSAIYVFLSIAVGNLLVVYLGREADLVNLMIGLGTGGWQLGQLVLFFLPVLFALFFLRKSMPRSKVGFHLLPLLACSVMCLILLLPLLPVVVEESLQEAPVGSSLIGREGIIVAVTGVLALGLTWLSHHHHQPHMHGKKPKH